MGTIPRRSPELHLGEWWERGDQVNRRNGHPTSFICEQSAEYILTRRLNDLLLSSAASPLLLHFSGTREGSRIAVECMNNVRANVAVVFARRPKVRRPRDELVTIKINDALFSAAEAAKKYGVPLLVGVPVVNDMLSLGMNAPCIWFQLMVNHNQGDIEMQIRAADASIHSETPPCIHGPLADNDICRLITSSRTFCLWDEIIRVAAAVRRAMPGGFYGPLYKPFIAVVPQE
jgi:hypothetical protein